MSFATTSADLEIAILIEVSQKDKYITYTWHLKRNNTNELIYKTETDSQTQKINPWLAKEKGQWKDLEIMILSKLSQTEKDKNCVKSLICGNFF